MLRILTLLFLLIATVACDEQSRAVQSSGVSMPLPLPNRFEVIETMPSGGAFCDANAAYVKDARYGLCFLHVGCGNNRSMIAVPCENLHTKRQ